MLLEPHEDLNPFGLTSLNHLIKDRIIPPLHKLPIHKGCGVVVIFDFLPVVIVVV
jgi:hypothetical protein